MFDKDYIQSRVAQALPSVWRAGERQSSRHGGSKKNAPTF